MRLFHRFDLLISFLRNIDCQGFAVIPVLFQMEEMLPPPPPAAAAGTTDDYDWLEEHLRVLERHLATGLWGIAAAILLLTLSVFTLLLCLCRLNTKYGQIVSGISQRQSSHKRKEGFGSHHLFS